MDSSGFRFSSSSSSSSGGSMMGGGSSSSIMGGGGGGTRASFSKSFFNHVFSSTDDSNSELMNVIQYALLAIIPVVVMNKLVQKIIPDADPDKSSPEILFEIMAQIALMFGGMVLIHRIITFVPTYSGLKYDRFVLTNATLTFLILMLSVQTKVGMKMNMLTDRLYAAWNGEDTSAAAMARKRRAGRVPISITGADMFPGSGSGGGSGGGGGSSLPVLVTPSSSGGGGGGNGAGGGGPAPFEPMSAAGLVGFR